MTEAIFLDGQCSTCKKDGHATYKMEATCQNCGTKVVAVLSRGHEAHHFAAICPNCGNNRWSIGSLVMG